MVENILRASVCTKVSSQPVCMMDIFSMQTSHSSGLWDTSSRFGTPLKGNCALNSSCESDGGRASFRITPVIGISYLLHFHLHTPCVS